MGQKDCFAEAELDRLRRACQGESRLVALYAFALRRGHDCDLAALFTETPPWPQRLELEMAVARALSLESVELMDLRRMPLVTRFNVINRGEPIYVGQPEKLALFIEETIVRYSSFYPLLEALYWKVETGPLHEE